MRSLIVASVLAVLGATGAAWAADEAPSTDQDRARLEAQIAKELGGTPAPATSPAPTPPPVTLPGAKGGGGALARILLLPDISAIGSFAAVQDSYDAQALSPRSGSTGPAGKPTFLFQELELALQAVVDPYARADVFISFSPGEVSVEEAYLTSLSLPAGLQVKAGRFFSQLGRINTTHPHTWDFLDGPLALGRVAAFDKLDGPGVDVSWLAPLPWFAELHLGGQSTDPYAAGRERLTGVARLSQFFALTEATTLGVGLSAARRDEGTGAFRDLGGIDLFAKYRPAAGRANLTFQGELFTRHFRGLASAPDGGNGAGGYGQLFWRQDPWWGYGVRYDQAPSAAAPGTERRWSAVADWFATEFERLGLQASYDQRPGGQTGWEWLLHLEFIIGAHGAHPF